MPQCDSIETPNLTRAIFAPRIAMIHEGLAINPITLCGAVLYILISGSFFLFSKDYRLNKIKIKTGKHHVGQILNNKTRLCFYKKVDLRKRRVPPNGVYRWGCK
jgi:hypothetical protein